MNIWIRKYELLLNKFLSRIGLINPISTIMDVDNYTKQYLFHKYRSILRDSEIILSISLFCCKTSTVNLTQTQLGSTTRKHTRSTFVYQLQLWYSRECEYYNSSVADHISKMSQKCNNTSKNSIEKGDSISIKKE